MASTVKTQILNALVSRLQQITTSNGYNRDVREVSRMAKMVSEPERDLIFIAGVREEKSYHIAGVATVDMRVFLACLVEDYSDLAAAVDDIAADVLKAISTDTTLGGLCIDANVISVEDEVISDNEPLASCLVEVSIKYRHAADDPYTAI